MVWYTRLDIFCNDCDSYYSRPRSVDDVAHQEEVVGVLKKSLEGSDVSPELSYSLLCEENIYVCVSPL